jgi:hypothetical protein
MRIPLIVDDNAYSYETVVSWKVVWDKICKMSYELEPPVAEIVTTPDRVRIEGIAVPMTEQKQSEFYSRQIPTNSDVITLDHMWSYYSKKHGVEVPEIVPEFKKLHVPRALFKSLGIGPWFRHSFPNCEITFWEE